MADFIEKIRLKGKAEEDVYFAELNRKLIEALHKKQTSKLAETDNLHDKEDTSCTAADNHVPTQDFHDH